LKLEHVRRQLHHKIIAPKSIPATRDSNKTPFSPAERRVGDERRTKVRPSIFKQQKLLILEIFVDCANIWGMTVSLSPQLEAWIAARVKNGVYNNTEQVLTQALELLKMQEELETQSVFLSQDAKRRAALRELVEQGQLLNMGY
jgi:putative addiction module CopG family antidote